MPRSTPRPCVFATAPTDGTAAGATTFMLRMVPLHLQLDSLLEEINFVFGSLEVFDFVYLPWDVAKARSCGYAFVNFTDECFVKPCLALLHNHSFGGCGKCCTVHPAHTQGAAANVQSLIERTASGALRRVPMVAWKGRIMDVHQVGVALRRGCGVGKPNLATPPNFAKAVEHVPAFTGSTGLDFRHPKTFAQAMEHVPAFAEWKGSNSCHPLSALAEDVGFEGPLAYSPATRTSQVSVGGETLRRLPAVHACAGVSPPPGLGAPHISTAPLADFAPAPSRFLTVPDPCDSIRRKFYNKWGVA